MPAEPTSTPKLYAATVAEDQDGRRYPRLLDIESFNSEMGRKPRGARVYLALWDEEQAQTDAQRKYWHGCCVETVRELWRQKTGNLLPHDAVYGALAQAILGTVETPLGPQRVSTARLSKAQYSKLIEGTHEYVRTTYPGSSIPTPEEWNGDPL